MKHAIISTFFLFLLVVSSFAQKSSIERANALYAKGDYASAIKAYENIIATDSTAPELYYNLGNAYYRTDEIGRSILNYEKALRIYPQFEDAKINLQLAQSKVIDNIVQTPSFFLRIWADNIISLLNSNQWFYVSFLSFFIGLIVVFLFIFGKTITFRKISFYAGCIVFSISLMTAVFAGIVKNKMLHHREAIILSGIVVVKSSPDESGTDLFQLHEGTKVVLKSDMDKWIEIELGNGSIGWIEQDNVGVI